MRECAAVVSGWKFHPQGPLFKVSSQLRLTRGLLRCSQTRFVVSTRVTYTTHQSCPVNSQISASVRSCNKRGWPTKSQVESTHRKRADDIASIPSCCNVSPLALGRLSFQSHHPAPNTFCRSDNGLQTVVFCERKRRSWRGPGKNPNSQTWQNEAEHADGFRHQGPYCCPIVLPSLASYDHLLSGSRHLTRGHGLRGTCIRVPPLCIWVG